MDNEQRVDNERLVLGIVGSEYVAEKQTVITKSAGRVACSVNLQISQKCATVGWRQNMSAHSNGAYVFARARDVIYYIYIYIHKAEKLSVRLHFVCIFCVELILTVGAWIDVKLAQNESYIF